VRAVSPQSLTIPNQEENRNYTTSVSDVMREVQSWGFDISKLPTRRIRTAARVDPATGKSAANAALPDAVGSQPGFPDFRTDCPHLTSLRELPTPPPLSRGQPCRDCSNTKENWLCLTCHSVYCGRFANRHMVQHREATGHSVVYGFDDMSFWCYGCESYLHPYAVPQIHEIYQTYHKVQFGHAAPVPRN